MSRVLTRGRSRAAVALSFLLSAALAVASDGSDARAGSASSCCAMASSDYTSPQGFKASMPPRWLARLESDSLVVEHEGGARAAARLVERSGAAASAASTGTNWVWKAVGSSATGLSVATRDLPDRRRAIALRIAPRDSADVALLEFESGADGRDRELIDAQRILRTIAPDDTSSPATVQYAPIIGRHAIQFGHAHHWSDPTGSFSLIVPNAWDVPYGGRGYDAKGRQTGLYVFLEPKDGRGRIWFGDPRVAMLYRLTAAAVPDDVAEMPFESGAAFLYRYVPQAVADRCAEVRYLRTIERPDIARLLGSSQSANRSEAAPLPSTFEVFFTCGALADAPDRTPWVGSVLAATERFESAPGASATTPQYWGVRLVQGWIARAPDGIPAARMQREIGRNLEFAPSAFCQNSQQLSNACFASVQRYTEQSRAIVAASDANYGRIWGSGDRMDAAFAAKLKRLIALMPAADVTDLASQGAARH